MQDVANATVPIKVFISHDKPNKELPAPVEAFGFADEAVEDWV
jgi:hypothetical protein